MNMLEYKGYLGAVEFDAEAGLFHGEVVNTRDVITFQGESVSELRRALQDSVDDYLAFCAQRGEQPDKPFSGQFVTRIPPELHREATLVAKRAGLSLNAWVSKQLQSAVTDQVVFKVKTSSGRGKAKGAEAKGTAAKGTEAIVKRSSAIVYAGSPKKEAAKAKIAASKEQR